MAKKVLIVDDSMTARLAVVDLLRDFTGLQLLEAQDGNDGMQKLEKNPDIALVLSDINMPWMNGLEMVKKMKDRKELKNIPVCLLTTESSNESLAEAKKMGVNAFLVKPIRKEQLVAVVSTYIDEAV